MYARIYVYLVSSGSWYLISRKGIVTTGKTETGSPLHHIQHLKTRILSEWNKWSANDCRMDSKISKAFWIKRAKYKISGNPDFECFVMPKLWRPTCFPRFTDSLLIGKFPLTQLSFHSQLESYDWGKWYILSKSPRRVVFAYVYGSVHIKPLSNAFNILFNAF